MLAVRRILARLRATAMALDGQTGSIARVLRHVAPWAGLLVALGYLALVGKFTEFRSVYEFDPDEGNNVVKALLLARGYRFGAGIWSDQPPGFSYLLWGVFRCFGWQVVSGRWLVIVFAAALLAVVYDSLRRSYGHLAAFSAVLLLVCSQGYVELSVSIMLGMPCIALTMVAVWGLVCFQGSRRLAWLLVSGAAMGAALSTKLFVAFVVPVCALALLVWGWQSANLKRGARDAAVWTFSVAFVAAIGLAPVLFSSDPASLYRAHRIASEVGTPVPQMLGANMVPRFIKDDSSLFLLALLGAYQGLLQRRAVTTLASLWLGVGLVAVSRHYPVWTHHRLLLTVPGALLAGAAIPGLLVWPLPASAKTLTPLGWLRAKFPVLLRATVPLLAIFALRQHSPLRFERMSTPPAWTSRERDMTVENILRRYRRDTHFMVTARQMYAFRTGIPIPPGLAITSAKRFFSGLLDANSIIAEIEHYRPEQVILTARWPGSVRIALRKYLQPAYARVFQDHRNQNVEVYISKPLAQARGDAPPDGPPAEDDAATDQDTDAADVGDDEEAAAP